MIRDGKDIPTGKILVTQVCVVGSGPAGITTAWNLQKRGIKVILIEGGQSYNSKVESWSDKVWLFKGETEGQIFVNQPDFLILPHEKSNIIKERERIFGGTSCRWGGQSRPMDNIDMEKRQGVSGSAGFPGWPINRSDLDPYYAKAVNFCRLYGEYKSKGENFKTCYWEQILGVKAPLLKGFTTDVYQFIGDPYLNFAYQSFNENAAIGESPVDVILNANLLNINYQNGNVNKLTVASLDPGSPPKKLTEFNIKADVYILACGAIENARQLLLSNAGNENDLVGRYFTGHPIIKNGLDNTITITKSPFTKDQINFMSGGGWQDPNNLGHVEGRFVPNTEQTIANGIGRCWFRAHTSSYYFELAPDPSNRVMLTGADTVDPVFKLRQSKVVWNPTSQDEYTYLKTTALFKKALANLGGEVKFTEWEVVKNQLVFNGHHIGTTRMSNDYNHGVVDTNLKIHSLKNLYVVGSSVFPSAGISNPTFTIISLAIRLAEHISELLNPRS